MCTTIVLSQRLIYPNSSLVKDTTSFFVWIESRKLELNHLFKEHIFKTWENAVQQENRHAQEMLKDHHVKRTTKLRRVQKREMYEEGLMREYVIKTSAWSSSIQVRNDERLVFTRIYHSSSLVFCRM